MDRQWEDRFEDLERRIERKLQEARKQILTIVVVVGLVFGVLVPGSMIFLVMGNTPAQNSQPPVTAGSSPISGGPAQPSASSASNDAPTELPSNVTIPPALSEEEFAVLTLEEARDHLSQVSRARQNETLDDETKARLKREYLQLVRLVDELRDRDVVIPQLPDIVIPEPMSAEQIAAMTLVQANMHLAEVAKARQLGNLDQASAERLKREFSDLMRHITMLRRQGN